MYIACSFLAAWWEVLHTHTVVDELNCTPLYQCSVEGLLPAIVESLDLQVSCSTPL